MRIGIDARMYRESGIGRYTRNLIEHLQNLDKINEYFILLKKDDYNSLKLQNNLHKVLADFGWYGISEQIKLPIILRKLNLDLVHFPHFNVPIFYRDKFVVTIHDLIHQHFQMNRATTLNPVTYKMKQLGYNKTFKNAVSKSEKILVPSDYIKDLLIKEWQINESRIIVTSEAVEDKFITIVGKMSKDKSELILEKFKINSPYLFYVGNAHPHKNVESLIKTFLNLKEKYPNLTLVLSGGDHYFWQRLKSEYNQESIIYTGFVTDEELIALYKKAEMFVMPSFEEGFGIPLLEAMANKCPVVSSNAGSLPEVGGNACVYFDPKDLEDMEKKIVEILANKRLRKHLIFKGNRRYKEFSWKKLAKQTLEVYRSCV